jgi:hypothetical protein
LARKIKKIESSVKPLSVKPQKYQFYYEPYGYTPPPEGVNESTWTAHKKLVAWLDERTATPKPRKIKKVVRGPVQED